MSISETLVYNHVSAAHFGPGPSEIGQMPPLASFEAISPTFLYCLTVKELQMLISETCCFRSIYSAPLLNNISQEEKPNKRGFSYN